MNYRSGHQMPYKLNNNTPKPKNTYFYKKQSGKPKQQLEAYINNNIGAKQRTTTINQGGAELSSQLYSGWRNLGKHNYRVPLHGSKMHANASNQPALMYTYQIYELCLMIEIGLKHYPII